MRPPLTVTVSGGVDEPGLTVTPVGELDLTTAAALHDAVTAALAADPALPVSVDLAGVTFCDASGLRVLLAAEANGVTLTSPGPTLRRLLDLTRPPPES